jgi:glycine betaine/proline transport system permease protein
MAAATMRATADSRGPSPIHVAWLLVFVASAILVSLRGGHAWVTTPPEALVVPLADWLNVFMDWFIATFGPLFAVIGDVIDYLMGLLRGFLQWCPWIAIVAAGTIVGLAAGGWRLGAFVFCSLLYIVVFDYWHQAMNTLTLVGIAVPLSSALGLVVGVIGFQYPRSRRVIEPLLDLMQSVPTFSYLIPAILLFGFGPVVGLVASIVYSCPPMIRNVILGLERVPQDIVEAGYMVGCDRRQHLWLVRFRAALPAVAVGLNQTIMTTLAMVILAAIVGGFNDIGWEVLSNLRKAQFGQSIQAGLVIALLAMLMDRISRGLLLANRRPRSRRAVAWHRRHAHLVAFAIAVPAAFALALAIPALGEYPKHLGVSVADDLNRAVAWFTINYYSTTEAIKTWTLFFFLFPIKNGLERTVSPYTWGFELTAGVKIAYAVAIAGGSLLVAYLTSWRLGLLALILGCLYYFGTTGVPWLSFIAVIGLFAYQVGGWRVASFAVAGMAFMALTGIWHRAMLSVELCGAAVLISFVVGSALGIWAARSDRASAVLRPICDTLQTIPQFVFLIPVMMVFLIGEFSALLAIVMYAIVPPIRYMENGIRTVPKESVEAGRAVGCSEFQLLWRVQLPLAAPVIMLGLNQTILMALYMLVVAALVGSLGLGQMVYAGVGNANFGDGAVAGLGIAFIAMIADKILQSLTKKRSYGRGVSA